MSHRAEDFTETLLLLGGLLLFGILGATRAKPAAPAPQLPVAPQPPVNVPVDFGLNDPTGDWQ